ncbi:MAG TPA: hypothetical protein VFB14_12430 [Bryobacteraceae bacterium]|jgi:hypothetical protein|nr:hypothetical protein [Bryobacteraceae bacterium]
MSKYTEVLEALKRLFRIAMTDTGQARQVADFLLSWHNAAENGGWDPTDLWNVDDEIADDILTVLQFPRVRHEYAGELGFRSEMRTAWEQWRGASVQKQ